MTSICCEYTHEPISELLNDESTFAVFSFNGDTQPASDPRHINTGLQQLANTKLAEVWRSSLPVSTGTTVDGISWSSNGELLFCALQIEQPANDHLSSKIEHSYTQLLQFIGHKQFPYIHRAWNYLPDITAGDDDTERYKQFCLGRHTAFEQHAKPYEYPAACALGHHSGNIIVYLLASATPGLHVENPKQLSAFKYPRQYGPRSPSFARATLAGSQLYISGTASIRGHETLHRNCLTSQLALTLDNIDELLQHAQQSHQLASTPKASLLKVYIRHPEDYPTIKAAVENHFNNASILYVQADICRQELLVEIDGQCSKP